MAGSAPLSRRGKPMRGLERRQQTAFLRAAILSETEGDDDLRQQTTHLWAKGMVTIRTPPVCGG